MPVVTVTHLWAIRLRLGADFLQQQSSHLRGGVDQPEFCPLERNAEGVLEIQNDLQHRQRIQVAPGHFLFVPRRVISDGLLPQPFVRKGISVKNGFGDAGYQVWISGPMILENSGEKFGAQTVEFVSKIGLGHRLDSDALDISRIGSSQWV
jgi:hypothetical protein